MTSTISRQISKIAAISLWCVLALAGCSNSNTHRLTAIDVTPLAPSIAVAGTQQFTATATYGNGTHADITSQVTWNSGTPAVATISTGGLATGVAAGSSTITATLGTVSGSTSLTVTASGVTLQSITVAPLTPSVPVGGAVDFVATGHFSDGSTQVLPGATWGSGTPATASILASGGVAVGLATGTSVITATSGTVSGNTTLTVAPAVARVAYVSGSTDGNAAIYALKSASATLLPIGSIHLNNLPLQIVPEPIGRFAFALQANVITTLTVSANGRLTGPASGSAPTLTTNVSAIQGVVDPTGRFLYVVDGATSLTSYAISPVDGSLTAIGSGITVGQSLASVITDRAGKFAYVADQNGNVVFAYSINQSTGALTALTTPSYTTGTTPQYPAIDPSNGHLFVPNFGDNNISAFTINADGSLTAVTGSPFSTGVGNGPTAAVVDGTGKFLYVTNVNDGTVSGISIGAGGVLGAAVSGSPYSTGSASSFPFGIAIDPANTTVALVNLGSNTVSAYGLNTTTGVLTPSALPQVETSANPFFINFELGVAPSPSVLPGAVYASNAVSGDISAFTSSTTTGALTAASGSPFTGIPGNSFAAADLQGRALFTGSAAGIQIAGFGVNQSSAALTALTGSPLAVTGTDLASAVYVDPTSGFAYALDVTSGAVVQNTVDPVSGSVTGPGTSTSAFAGANNLAADPQGDFIYVLGRNATNGIQPFTTYNPNETVAVSAQPTNFPGNWTSGAVDGSGQFLVAVDSTTKTLKSFSITPAGTANVAQPDGTLIAVATSGSVILSGAGPWVVAFDPLDRAIYVADQTAGTITPYAFTAGTGALGAAGSPVTVSANGLTNISTDIAGAYLYAGVKAAVAPGSKGAVAVYSIGSTGALTAVAGSPFTTGTGDAGVAATNVVK